MINTDTIQCKVSTRCSLGISLFRPHDGLCAPANSTCHPQVILFLTASSFAFTALRSRHHALPLKASSPLSSRLKPSYCDTQISHSHRFKLSRQQHTRNLASRAARALARDAYYITVYGTISPLSVPSLFPFALDRHSPLYTFLL